MTSFQTLSQTEQSQRLSQFEQKRKALSSKYNVNLKHDIFSIVQPAEIKSTADGKNKIALFRLVHWNHKTNKSIFVQASAFISTNNTKLESYYKNLQSKQLVSVDFVETSPERIRIWKMLTRER